MLLVAYYLSTELTVRRDTSSRLKWPDVSPFKSFSRELSYTEKNKLRNISNWPSIIQSCVA